MPRLIEPSITSPLVIDNLSLSGNSVTTTSGNLLLTPVAGSACIIDSHWSFDGDTMTALTDANTVLNAYAGRNITIESVTFDGGVMGGISSLAISVNTSSTTPQLIITQSGTGDAAMRFTAGGTSWAMGVDNGTSDEFTLCRATALGDYSGTAIRIDSSSFLYRDSGDGMRFKSYSGAVTAPTYNSNFPLANFVARNADGWKSGVVVSTSGQACGVALTSPSSGIGWLSTGVVGDSSTHVKATATTGALIAQNTSNIDFYTHTGMTIGNTYALTAMTKILSLEGSTGYLLYGTHNAIGAETLTGYIEIKDAGGTVRKVGIIS